MSRVTLVLALWILNLGQSLIAAYKSPECRLNFVYECPADDRSFYPEYPSSQRDSKIRKGKRCYMLCVTSCHVSAQPIDPKVSVKTPQELIEQLQGHLDLPDKILKELVLQIEGKIYSYFDVRTTFSDTYLHNRSMTIQPNWYEVLKKKRITE